ncbi:hypothetical protein ACTMTI_44935 [Nonomuraea sp. H19]|uniref:hypothetical protein n=1 Tax=Nonomuraea sp. H19 TaxID=3452206 RepID=UPI003F8CEAB5
MDRNEVAYLSGGRRRVALAALATLVIEGRMRLSHDGKLYSVAGAGAADPVEEVALAQRSGLREALATMEGHESVRAVEEDLLHRGLVARRWLGLSRRPAPAGKELIEQARTTKGRGAALTIALNGLVGIPDLKIRRQFGGAVGGKGSLRGQGTGGWSAGESIDGPSGSSL